MVIGILALVSGKTDGIIIISVFGALTLYILSMISLLLLRKNQPGLHRPFRVPFYPLFPWTALIIAVVSLIALFVYNFALGAVYFAVLLAAFLLYKLVKTPVQ
jgi:ethanolamine permease